MSDQEFGAAGGHCMTSGHSADLVKCPLCWSSALSAFVVKNPNARYFLCGECDLRFLDPAQRLSPSEEKARYEEHNNDVNDVRYQEFLQPICDIIKKQARAGDLGLDYGAGTGPLLAEMLTREGYKMSVYDPFFWPAEEVLKQKYNFISLSEVAEHFYHPREEFLRLREMLLPGGFLAIMTLIYDPKIDFETWYYRRDPTHVSFYSKKTIEWIAGELNMVSDVAPVGSATATPANLLSSFLRCVVLNLNS